MTRNQIENASIKLGTVAAILLPLLALCGWAWSAAEAADSAGESAVRNERRIDDHEQRLRACEVQAGIINAKLDAIADAVGAKKGTP